MYQNLNDPRGRSPISVTSVSVIGAGIAGAWHALLLAQTGRSVTLHERSDAAMTQSTSHWAGGMLAPYCEAESTEPLIVRLGLRSLKLWRDYFPDTPFNGSLVVAHPRDRTDFERFAKLTSGYRRLDGNGVREIEPSLDGRFREGLFYPDEGHVEPRKILPELHARIRELGGKVHFGSTIEPDDVDGAVIDCRGLVARDTQTDLRGVKGELILIETDEVELQRPVRLIHPRFPLYIIPRGGGRFMLGATSIETESSGVSVRSALELLGAAYAVHPAFGEARILEFGSGLRPAFPDNLPRITIDNQKIAVNGLYRHGFLLAPALAELTLGYLERGTIDNEVLQCA
jgi:glycine oxidase